MHLQKQNKAAMPDYTITIEDTPSSEDIQRLRQGLATHALSYTQAPGFQSIAVFLRDEAGTVIGGIWGYINWNWLSVGLVWLSEELRGQGYGKQLMIKLEEVAKARGCQYAHLDTFSYQARPFYETLGYELFATLGDYPPGHQRFFLKKILA
jgi:GNAT superfamily N-acetyltransferase